eukprot:CAMPEP_0202375264 /NCGR_PEP_ID=MMETSP1127-20130417/5971_1 /ASSEMBLY_ACC=CAM_ASM_000462 /TAXON_ID=3047 /ORGANISM="Dunaliella tertiolecta, Strain CCMP1320" /LENGTH=110 /DNA_ID=CAMNT_0048972689 /DNA_START=358 /DNA_END=688 /DNA_ORIENTATION=-
MGPQDLYLCMFALQLPAQNSPSLTQALRSVPEVCPANHLKCTGSGPQLKQQFIADGNMTLKARENERRGRKQKMESMAISSGFGESMLTGLVTLGSALFADPRSVRLLAR